MKLPNEILNGIIVFFGIALYFLLMEMLGFSNLYYLRVLNVLIVFYGVYRTLHSNMAEGKLGFVTNIISTGLTAFIGIALSAIGLLVFIYIKGGNEYLNSLSKSFLFGGNPSINQYCIGLFFEGIASAVVVVFTVMLLWKGKTSVND